MKITLKKATILVQNIFAEIKDPVFSIEVDSGTFEREVQLQQVKGLEQAVKNNELLACVKEIRSIIGYKNTFALDDKDGYTISSLLAELKTLDIEIKYLTKIVDEARVIPDDIQKTLERFRNNTNQNARLAYGGKSSEIGIYTKEYLDDFKAQLTKAKLKRTDVLDKISKINHLTTLELSEMTTKTLVKYALISS